MSKNKAKWWQFSVMTILIIVALFALRFLTLSRPLYRLLQVVVVVAGYLLLAAWMRINAGAIETEDQRQHPAPPIHSIQSEPDPSRKIDASLRPPSEPGPQRGEGQRVE